MRHTLPSQTVAALLAAVCVSAEEIEPTGLYGLPQADVVLLGEHHDNPAHHAHQAIAVEAVGARALVLEMLTEAEALRITPELRESEPALEAVLGWNASGWPDFAMYYPIFAAAGDAAIFGGALEHDRVRQAVTDGAAAMFGDAAPLFGLDDALDDAEQGQREADQLAAHCDALPVAILAGMVEAQRLRDAALARAVIAAFAETGGPVAVITGNGHARTDWGVPRALEQAAPDLSVISVGQFEAAPPAGDPPFDFWLVTEAVERPDPCDTFEQR